MVVEFEATKSCHLVVIKEEGRRVDSKFALSCPCYLVVFEMIKVTEVFGYLPISPTSQRSKLASSQYKSHNS